MEKLIYTWEQQVSDTNKICDQIEKDEVPEFIGKKIKSKMKQTPKINGLGSMPIVDVIDKTIGVIIIAVAVLDDTSVNIIVIK